MSAVPTWADVKRGIENWSAVVRQLHGDTPHAARLMLHVARALLVQDTSGLPYGYVDHTHPLAIQVQLAEIAWEALTDEQRVEGERALRAAHGLCTLPRCRLPVQIGLMARGRR